MPHHTDASSPPAPGGLSLDEEECLRLLASTDVGRVGVSIGALPAIFPVTYRMLDDRLLFFAADVGPLRSALSDTVVAFQADHTDPLTRAGWSVQAVGVARLSDAPEDRRAAAGRGLVPARAAAPPALVAFRPARVSGWLLPESVPTAWRL